MALGGIIRGFFGGIWRFLTGLSRVITVLIPLLFLGVFVTSLVIGFKGAAPEEIPEKTALVVAPSGFIVENRSPLEPLEAFMQDEQGEVLLSDLVKAINLGAKDERITVLVLDLQAVAGPSVAHTIELKKALDNFKASGKPIVAMGDYYAQGQYLLAAQADHVLLHPKGSIELTGFAAYRTYMRQLLANARVTMNIFRVGEYKSAVEPFLRDDMSEGEREVVSQWLGKLWSEYTTYVEDARGLSQGFIDSFVAEFPDRLDAVGGDGAQMMADAGLVDELLFRDAQESYIAELVGATEDDGSFVGVGVDHYLMAQGFLMTEAPDEMKPRIAVVPIEGELVPGESGSGFAGADTIVEQIERALELERLSAVVLRVNSPGGSVFASEVIRQKVLQIKEQGIPVLVSMGAVAASGGYYIAADADQIWALPGTITGSIGVFAAFPTVEKLYDWVGASVDGVASTPLAAAIRFETGIAPMGERIINSYIGRVYQDFVGLVAEGRGKTWDEIDAIAGGRVWSGADAQEIGLVDQLGTLANTIDAAAELAEIDEWEVRLIGTPISPEQLFLEQLGRNLGTASVSKHSVVARFASQLAVPLRTLDSLQDPRNLYVRCLECNPGL